MPGCARFSAPPCLQQKHVLDWYHIAMRWQHIHQLATGHHGASVEARVWLLDRIDRAKWALWNGQQLKTFGYLADLRAWTWTARADPSWLSQLRTHLCELTHYLDANADSLPNYGMRHRAGAAISTAFVESAVNEIMSRRMVKRQQMRWNRFTVQPFLTVRVHVLNATLEEPSGIGIERSGQPRMPRRSSRGKQRRRPTTLHALRTCAADG
jgi:hypothetical protein